MTIDITFSSMNAVTFLSVLCLAAVEGIPETYDAWRQDLDCFVVRGRDLRLKNAHVDKYLSVNSLEECKKECDLTFINCKSFSYNHDPNDILDANCFLSREDGSVLDTRDFERDFDFKKQFSFYERVQRSFCDTRFGSLNSLSRAIGVGFRLPGRDDSKSGGCYRLVRTSLRISNRHIMKSLRTRDRMDCEAECSKARDFTCRAFNYRTSQMTDEEQETYTAFPTNIYKENCELSNQDTYGVTLDDRYVFFKDPDFDFYERTGFGRECDGKAIGRDDDSFGAGSNINSHLDDCFELFEKEQRLDSRIVKDRRSVKDLQACKEECARARNYDCKSLAFSYSSSGSTWRANENCHLSDREAKYFGRFDTIYDRSFDLYERDEDDRYGNCMGSGTGSRGVHNPYGREGGYDTVSGKKCIRDPCREDRYGRFFFCETDNSGGWDYCCRPGTTCSDPTGEQYYWCFVGSELTDQWRPCTVPSGRSTNRDYLLESAVDNPFSPEEADSLNRTADDNPDLPFEIKDLRDFKFPE